MHAITPCTAFSTYSSYSASSDAGRLPIAAPIPTRPLYNAIKFWEAALDVPAEDTPAVTPIPARPFHVVANNLQKVLDVQDFNPARDSPFASLPVPQNRKKDPFTLDDFVLADQIALIKRTRTFDKLEIQENLHSDRLSWSLYQHTLAILESTERYPTMSKLENLERQGTLSGDKGDDSIVLAETKSSLKRSRKVNKRAGLNILKRCGIRMARLFGRPILQAHLRP